MAKFNFGNFAPEFDLETENLGTIHCKRALSIGALWDIGNFLENENLDGPEFARELLRRVGKKHNNQNQNESEGEPLSDSDLEEVTDKDIEKFARQYVTDNKDLHFSLRPRAKPGPKPEGEEESGSADSSSFEIPKESGESDSGYLLRLLKLRAERQRQDMELRRKHIAKMFPKPIFSNSTRELMQNQMTASERLHDLLHPPGLSSLMRDMDRVNAFASISERISPVNDSVSEILHHIDSPQVTMLKTLVENAGRAEALAEEQREILAGSAELQKDTNNTLFSMHRDAGKQTSILIFVAVTSLFVSAVGIAFTVWLQWQDNRQAVEQNALIQTQIQAVTENQDKRMIDALAAFNAAQEAQGARLEKLTEALVADNKAESESARQELQELIKVLAEALRPASDGGEGQ